MKVHILSLMLSLVCLVTASPKRAVALTPQFTPPGPGINAPLATGSATVGVYGEKIFETGPWIYGGEASITGTNGSALRYESTLQNQTARTAMPVTQNWLLQLDYRHTGAFLNNDEWPFFVKASEATLDNRIVKLRYVGNGTTDNWAIYKGGSLGSWDNTTPIVTGLALGTGFNTFSFLYKAATQKMDFYLNNVLTVADFSIASGDYGIDFIQLEWARTGTDSYKNLTLSQYAGEVPEPTTMILLIFGAVVTASSLRRRG
jgi:hypothetical protein